MPWKGEHPEVIDMLVAALVSIVSGFIAVSRRIIEGHRFTFLWVISEFLTAILCGYLMYTAYPHIKAITPSWFTMPIAVALAAHIGGRVFQELEKQIIERYKMAIKYKY